MNAGDWVESRLQVYCLPTEHEFHVVAPGGNRWCTVCFKEERADGRSCRVCSAEVPDALANILAEDEELVPGALCDVCADAIGAVSGGRYRALRRAGSWETAVEVLPPLVLSH